MLNWGFCFRLPLQPGGTLKIIRCVCVYFSSQMTSLETFGNCFKVVLIMDSAKSRYWRPDVQCPVLYLTPANSIVANYTFALNVCGICSVLSSIHCCTCILPRSLSVCLVSLMQLSIWASIARGILMDLYTLGLDISGFSKACKAFPSDVKQSICLAFFSTIFCLTSSLTSLSVLTVTIFDFNILFSVVPFDRLAPFTNSTGPSICSFLKSVSLYWKSFSFTSYFFIRNSPTPVLLPSKTDGGRAIGVDEYTLKGTGFSFNDKPHRFSMSNAVG